VKNDSLAVGIVSIATNNYILYWKELAQSLEEFSETEVSFTLHILTDDVDLADQISQELKKVTIKIYQIDPLGWPEATLMRYKLMEEHSSFFEEEVLMYLDSDMKVLKIPPRNLFESCFETGMALVEHPGFYRPKGFRRVILYLFNPRIFITDLRSIKTHLAIGSWETNQKSTAYVSKQERKFYYCGGAWFGKNENFKGLVRTLRKRVDDDLENGVVAIWHDESHLNAFISDRRHSISLPEYCYEISFPQLKNISCKIAVVNKNLNSIWNRD
jgi:hypothetical protein